MNAITNYLAGVLTVIALGISMIAYNLVAPRTQPIAGSGVDGLTNTATVTGTVPADTTDGAIRVTVMRDATGTAYAVPVRSTTAAPAASRYVERYVADEADETTAPAYRVAEEPMVVRPVRTVRTVEVEQEPRRVVARTVERENRRDWKRTAMVIGGSTAAGAGVGGIFAGKKGALIGAAIAGGVSTIHQTR